MCLRSPWLSTPESLSPQGAPSPFWAPSYWPRGWCRRHWYWPRSSGSLHSPGTPAQPQLEGAKTTAGELRRERRGQVVAPACLVPGSWLGGAGHREIHQTWEGFLEEVTASWDLGEEQALPKWHKRGCFRQREQQMPRLQGGNSPGVCREQGAVRGTE